MTFNIFALCKINNNLEVRKISVTNAVQLKIEQIFEEQKNNFNAGIREIVHFTGDWRPENDELLEIPIPQEANIIIQALEMNLTGIQELNLNNFETEPIKALFGQIENGEILIQLFLKSQYLSRSFSLFLEGSTYNELSTPTITLNNKLLCYISNNTLKFKSFNNLRYLFNLSELYIEATDADIDNFASNTNIEFEDVVAFKNSANQNNRKRIHNILQSDRLNNYSALDIKSIAEDKGLRELIEIRNNRVFLPQNNTQLSKILSFLDEKLYVGPFSNNIIRANSTKIER